MGSRENVASGLFTNRKPFPVTNFGSLEAFRNCRTIAPLFFGFQGAAHGKKRLE